MAFGLVNAGSSVGQLILAPIAGLIIVNFGWVSCIIFLSIILLMVLPLSFLLRSRAKSNKDESTVAKSLSETLSIAFKTPSYIYLVTGFFVCGFHVEAAEVSEHASACHLSISAKHALLPVLSCDVCTPCSCFI